jgi:hypothetical protein
MLEMLLPDYTKKLLENYQNIYSQLASQLRWLYFDDSFRLVTRVGYLDDGWIRLRLDGHWEFTGELIREMSWIFYNIAETNKLLDLLSGALASKATDKLRVSVVDVIPLSPFNLTQISGTTLTGRDWSQDFAKLQNLDTTLSSRASESTLSTLSSKFPSAVALSDSLSNPTTTIIGSALLGFDGTYFRRVAVDTSSRLRVVVESVVNPSNLDVALSTRASESTLSAIAGALASKATDKLRVSVVDALPRSPFYLTDSSGNELSSYFMNYQNIYSQLASQLRWLYFDDSFRLVTRVGYLDDGWIRLRLDGHWEFTGELIREMSWVFYNLAETNRLLTKSVKTFERTNVSISAGSTYSFLNLSGIGIVQELLIVASQNTFRVDVVVDNVTIWSKSYSDASNLTDVIPTMSAFQREDGKYIYYLSMISFKSSVQINIVNLDTVNPITLDYVYCKYEVA